MEPVSILGVAGMSTRLAATACSLGEILLSFIKDAKVVDQTLVNLALQTRTVKELCVLISDMLQSTDRDPQFYSGITTRPTQSEQMSKIVRAISDQLVDCEQTLKRLCESTQGIRLGPIRAFDKAWAQLKLNLCKESMTEARSQLSLHLLTLNAYLQIFCLQVNSRASPESRRLLTLGNEMPMLASENTECGRNTCLPQETGLSTLCQGHDASDLENNSPSLSDVSSDYSSFGGRSAGWYHDANPMLPGQAAGDKFAAVTVLETRVGSGWKTASRVKPPELSELTANFGGLEMVDITNAGALAAPVAERAQIPHFVRCSMIDNALDAGISRYHTERYYHARQELRRAAKEIDQLPPTLRSKYDVFGIEYMHAVATYYSRPSSDTIHSVLRFTRRQAVTDPERLCIAHVLSLLAFSHVELHQLDSARLISLEALNLCLNVRETDQRRLDDCFALSARIENLLKDENRAEALENMISLPRRDLLMAFCARHPHRQGLDLEERKTLFRTENWFFAKTSFCEKSGKVKILWGRKWGVRGLGPERPDASHQEGQCQKVTGLHIAALFGDANLASKLIEAGADVNAEAHVKSFNRLSWKCNNPLTPLACAVLLRHQDTIRLLISKGAQFTTRNGTSVAAAITNKAFLKHDSFSLRETLECLRFLGWDINSPLSTNGGTLLHQYTLNSNASNTFMLIRCGASVVQKNGNGDIPLNMAIARRRQGPQVLEVIRLLLQQQKQQQLVSRNHRGLTPLLLAIRCKHLSEQVALCLLQAGADPHAQDHEGRSFYAWLQTRWDWTGVSKFLMNATHEVPCTTIGEDSSQG